jgi:sulfite reductase (ferredoxin)
MSAEALKLDSEYLAGTIADELANDADDFDDDAEILLKFHGIYQQDDRDVRRARTQLKLPLDYSCMVRASVPGGVITPDQWLALDRLSALADNKLRLTTRQGVQFHVVHKRELHELVSGINASLLTTLAACGDVVRNVMACPLPHPERRTIVEPLVAQIVARFRPQAETYWELWVDGDKAVTAEPGAANSPRTARTTALDPVDDVEPIYGKAYLPRKFKIAVGWPGDNCVDIYTNDVGIVPTLSEGTSGELTGFMVFAGGGMGMSHSRPEDTYPLLAHPVGWVPASGPDDLSAVVDVAEAIVTTQRDHGNREDRQRARLKYLLEAKGVDWLRDQIEARTGRPLAAPVELPDWTVQTHHGWHGHDITGDETSVLGLPVQSGKVAGGLRVALKRLINDKAVRELRVTARQDLLLLGVTDRAAVEAVLRGNGVALASDQAAVRNISIACPALPTCSKALGEAERVLPDVVERLEKELADAGVPELPLALNMSGCPNGCSRPYAAELGIVGRTKKNYDVFVGGSPAGDRLARLLRADVPLDDVPALVRPLIDRYAQSGTSDAQRFGDWCVGQDWDELQALLPAPTGRRARRAAATADAD